MDSPEVLERLIKTLSRLPAIGRRSAERMALKLVQNRKNLVRDLILVLEDAEQNICCCSKCGNITRKDNDPCKLCTDPRRDGRLLCVVEGPGDILLIEQAGGFRGRYHALMAKISPMKGEGVQDLKTEKLLKRIKDEHIEEVILALNSDVESDATASFLHDVLVRQDVKVSRIAAGLPAGSGIAYSDPVTLARAIRGRQEM